MPSAPTLREGKLLLLIGAVQFVNVLDFVMVMPLGPDFARALGVPTAALGLVGGSYTAAAAVSGLLGALVLDRFDRRNALACAMFGLVLATAAGGLAVDLPSLLAARVAAGTFGGPASSLTLAIIADAVPIERRGRAFGAVMGAFSIASVLGVPAGLELAEIGGWQLPFFAVAALGALVTLSAVISMPPFRGHLRSKGALAPTSLDALGALASERAGAPTEPSAAGASLPFLLRPAIRISLACTALSMMSMFSVVPHIAAHLQFNLGYPRDRLGLLYLAGGSVSFVSMRLAGALSDRVGPALTGSIGSLLFMTVLYLTFIAPGQPLPVLALFVGFMVTNSFRMIPMQALSSRVPGTAERARFMSAQSAVQHLASAAGAMLSTGMLDNDASGALVGIERVAWFALLLAALLPLLLHRLEARVKEPLAIANSHVA